MVVVLYNYSKAFYYVVSLALIPEYPVYPLRDKVSRLKEDTGKYYRESLAFSSTHFTQHKKKPYLYRRNRNRAKAALHSFELQLLYELEEEVRNIAAFGETTESCLNG